MCIELSDCKTTPFDYALEYLDDYPSLTPMGIAKDGYIIWGPYKEDGTLWQSCDVDICNGAYVDGENYGYALTTFHPYILGCFGPGSNLTMSQECSSNARQCSWAEVLHAGILAALLMALNL
eukprot:CAMPEP_0202965436 /NCGR_PEP_ID=MMETSP1396-20130829/9412_1 /ASSEMBLY_ACC=CAM_ASM_000872 /TAXON_ID= /ORGANISM="Pseudokeronopsis sp., Strain Brazil" /LENGTH=121 /DNA_ID=CAMNT_0049688149 /DNA_START=685 /DNA_END=1050 /DNA_ORIENTATION=+